MSTLSFKRGNFQVSESGKAFVPVTITRTNGSVGNASVTLTPTGGTATAGQDYSAQSVVVNFASGETSKVVNIPVFDNGVAAPDKTVNLTLSNLVNATLGSQATATLTILNHHRGYSGSADVVLDYFDSGASGSGVKSPL